MRKVLTAAAVARMKPPAKGQIEIFDRGYPGLLLRVSYGGGKAFAMFYRHGGKLRRLTLGLHPAMTLAEAREAWRDARRLVALGQDPGHTPIKTSDTVANVVAEWIKRDKRDARPSTIYQIERALRYDVLPRWGGRDIGSISKREIHELLDALADRAPGTARSVHAHLRSLFRWAVGREIIAVDPMAGVKCPVKANRRDRVLSDDELVKVWHAVGADPFEGDGPAPDPHRRPPQEIRNCDGTEIDGDGSTCRPSAPRRTSRGSSRYRRRRRDPRRRHP